MEQQMRSDRVGRPKTASWEAGVVAAVFLVCLVGALAYVARFASWVPWWDYWELSEVIAREQPLDRAWLLAPHQEHRIPLSKLALVALARAVPDVRAAAVLDVLGCAGFALVALAAVYRLRGRLRWSDALIPLIALHVGHYTTFLLGFQLQMVISTGLVLSVFTLLLEPTRGRVAVAAGLLALLPLAGLNGVVSAPPLVLWLFWLLGSAARRSPGALGLAVVAASTTGALLIDSLRLVGGEPSDPLTSARTALQFVATGLGVPAARRAGLVAAGLATALAACAPALVAAFRDARRQRNEVVGICAVLVGGLALALVVGAGRGDHGPTAGIQHRYAVMSLLIVYALYFAAVVAGRTSSPGRVLQWVGLLAGILALVPAAKDGVRNGRHLERTLREAERKIPVLPDDVLGAELETLLHGGEAPVLEHRIGALRSVGLLPEAVLPAEEPLAAYRISLTRRLLAAGRRADAERQIDVLEQQGLVREAALLRALGAGRRPPD